VDAFSFRRRFAEKGDMTRYLESIPTFLVTTPHTGLIGASACIEAVNDERRHAPGDDTSG
jgi:glucokinase